MTRTNGWRGAAMALALWMAQAAALAFQLAPLGSSFEARFTNERPSTIARVAGRAGRLIKEPVHEEITQLASGCPLQRTDLPGDVLCQGADQPFAGAYVIYGVRWNDMPPFRLNAGEGAQCKKLLLRTAACTVSQTVNFSTQPECWLCLFEDAGKKSQTSRISGCDRGSGVLKGNLMTRSHFGDLQFLHAMASADNLEAAQTQAQVLAWVEFAWKVSSGEIGPQTRLKDVNIAALQEHFGCTEWTVADLYVLGQQQFLLPQIRLVAFGSVLHTVQDSFAEGHAEREAVAPAGMCPGTDMPWPRRVMEFHGYAGQDGHRHDEGDTRAAMLGASTSDWPAAVDASRRLFALKDRPWAEAQPYLQCLFELAPGARASSPGTRFKRPAL